MSAPRRSGLHPFSQRVALVLGGGLLIICAAVMVYVRTRVPSPAELDAKVHASFAPVDAARPLTTGARVPQSTALVVRARNQLQRGVHVAAFALDATGQVHWYVPAQGQAAVARLPADAAERVLPGADRRLPLGPTRLMVIYALEPLTVAAIQARVTDWWQADPDLRAAAPTGLGDAQDSIWISIVEQ